MKKQTESNSEVSKNFIKKNEKFFSATIYRNSITTCNINEHKKVCF